MNTACLLAAVFFNGHPAGAKTIWEDLGNTTRRTSEWAGPGSEELRFDDEVSSNHHWTPGNTLFLSADEQFSTNTDLLGDVRIITVIRDIF